MTVVGDLLVEFREKPGKGDEPPVLTLTERNGFVRQTDRFHKRLATEDVSKYKVVRRNDIAFNPYLLWAGAVAQNTIVDEGIISPLYPTFRVRDQYDPRYVARLLLTPQLIDAYDRIAFGSVPRRRRSSVEDFLNLPLVEVPPLPEQRRIAAILDHSDSLRAKRSQVLSHLDSLVQAIFTQMFTAGSFESIRAGTLMPRMRNGLSPSSAGTHAAQVLTLSAVTQGAFNPAAVKPGVFAVEPPADKRVTTRDFLMCRGSGNKALVGVGTYSRVDRPDLVFPDTVIAGTVDSELVAMPFLEVAWKRREVRAQIESIARTTNGTYKVNQRTLSSVLVQVPPTHLQEAFADRIEQVTRQYVAVQRGVTTDNLLSVSLQTRAFRGEL